jgi:hypothetical protein
MDAAQAGVLTGNSEWRGHYYYMNGESVEVYMWLTVSSNGTVTGRTEEAATFGDGSSPKLYANISNARLQGNDFSFTKTYDGRGGVSHSANYSGAVNADGEALMGTWATDISGWYFFVKVR